MIICHACSYGSYQTEATTMLDHFKCVYCKKVSPKPRTQKGKGLLALRKQFESEYCVPIYGFVQKEEDLPETGYPYFLRPAPSTPKHGYIDSRTVSSRAEAAQLLEGVLQDDPLGELIIMKKVDAQYNMVWTPSSMTVGKGHDGATAGVNTATIPLSYPKSVLFEGTLMAADVKDQPFIEALNSEDHGTQLTQLRNGPHTPGSLSGDYIPEPTLVREVILADAKLFKDRGWEKCIEEAVGRPGVVVWHPKGSITDHFSIHAFTAGFPIIFGEKCPVVGDFLAANTTKKAFDPMAMLRGVIGGERIPLTREKNEAPLGWAHAVRLILLTLHNTSAMTGEHSKWIGAAASLMLRLGCIALRGEIRHFGSNGSGKKSREEVYSEHNNRRLSYHQASVGRLTNIFRYGRWHSAGFGGPRWAMCGASTIALFNAIKDLTDNPSEENAGQVVRALNLAVNQAHNGGWWLNKFISDDSFNELQHGSVTAVLGVANAVYKVEQAYQSISDHVLSVRLERLKQWSRLTLAPPKATSARLAISTSTGGATIRVSSRLLKERFNTIHAHISDGVATKEDKQSVFLIESEDGYQLEKRQGDAVSIIWKEAPLMAAAEGFKLSGK